MANHLWIHSKFKGLNPKNVVEFTLDKPFTG